MPRVRRTARQKAASRKNLIIARESKKKQGGAGSKFKSAYKKEYKRLTKEGMWKGKQQFSKEMRRNAALKSATKAAPRTATKKIHALGRSQARKIGIQGKTGTKNFLAGYTRQFKR